MARNDSGAGVGGGTQRKHHKIKRGINARSRYPQRLAARGLTSKSVRMLPLDRLRKRAENKAKGIKEEDE